MEEEIIKDPWQWHLVFILTFARGKFGGGIVAKPFHTKEETEEYRIAFLADFEERCRAMKIEIRYVEDEIECVEGGTECSDGYLDPALEAGITLAKILRGWTKIEFMELRRQKVRDKDGYAVKQI